MSKKEEFLVGLIMAAVAGGLVWYVTRPGMPLLIRQPIGKPDKKKTPDPTPLPVKGKFVLVTRANCPFCSKLENETLTDGGVQAALAGYDEVKVDAGSRAEVKKYFPLVRGVPAYALVDGSGKVVRRGFGYRSPARFIAWMNGEDKDDGGG